MDRHKVTYCQGIESALIDATDPLPWYIRKMIKLNRLYMKYRYKLYKRIKKAWSRLKELKKRETMEAAEPQDIAPLNLAPGEWVEVKSLEEINATLDKRRNHKGLHFMPGMKKFCGGKYKVLKKITKIKLETTGEIRHFKTPTLILEGVYCEGDYHEGCERYCFHFWKEAWLYRASEV